MNKHQIKRKKAFTLVELIIVITILAILSTIAFVSFQNYTKDARDWNRITTLKNIESWLSLYNIKSSNYPDPDELVEILWTWNILLSKQWIVWNEVVQKIKLNKEALDPKDKTNYIYSITWNGQKYQLWTYLEENKLISYIPQITKTYANVDYSKRYFYTMWDKVWILIEQNTNQPIIKTQSLTWINLETNTGSFKVYFSNDTQSWNTISSWTNLIETIVENQKTTQTIKTPVIEEDEEILFTCPIDKYSEDLTTCIPVWTWYYSAAWDTSRIACSNKPENSTYTSSWDGDNNCNWICNSWYYNNTTSCETQWSWDATNGYVFKNTSWVAQYPTSCNNLLTSTWQNTFQNSPWNWTKFLDWVYFIKPDSNDAFKVYCDMTTDSGGWTLCFSTTSFKKWRTQQDWFDFLFSTWKSQSEYIFNDWTSIVWYWNFCNKITYSKILWNSYNSSWVIRVKTLPITINTNIFSSTWKWRFINWNSVISIWNKTSMWNWYYWSTSINCNEFNNGLAQWSNICISDGSIFQTIQWNLNNYWLTWWASDWYWDWVCDESSSCWWPSNNIIQFLVK